MDPLIHGLTLRFPPRMEREFALDQFRKSLRQVRKGLLVGGLVYAAFAVVDAWVIPSAVAELWAIRTVVLGWFLLVIASTFVTGLRRWIEAASISAVLVAGLGLIVMMMLAPFPEREIYFAGIMLVVIAGYTYMKLRFIPATTVSGLLWLAYNLVDIFIRDTPLAILLTNNFYLFGTNVVGMFAGYQMEQYVRLEFLARRRIEEKEAQISRVLLNVLPRSIAERLMREPGAIAERFSTVTIMFTDIVHFTQLSSRVSAEELVQLLNEIFSAFDELVEKHGLEKIKTIGDSYMAVAGVPTLRDDHPEAVAEFALDLNEALARLNASRSEPIRIRTGIHTGSVVAGVIGTKRFAYDLWGDAVNTASRMESHALPDTIQVTRATYERLRDRYELKRRGVIDVKGKGEMLTYLLVGRKS